jgi:SAM-dependent methyltransferase
VSLEYADLFVERGGAYQGAMERYPDARSEEFEQVVQAAALPPSAVVADVPAGGCYLQPYLPSGCRYLPHEPCSSFKPQGPLLSDSALLPLPWSDMTVDCAISLAGVHHIADKKPLLREILRVVKPAGRLVLSDVRAESPVARFLDQYVGANNSTGHEGVYLDEATLDELREVGWQVLSAKTEKFLWQFAGRAELADFCHRLFDLSRGAPADTLEAAREHLGIRALANGSVGLQWELMTIVAQRPQ